MKRLLIKSFVLACVACLVVGGRYGYYVMFEAAPPFSEVGVGLQEVMPQKVVDWGCTHLRQRFPENTAPGC